MSRSRKIVLVTGSSGAIGTAVARRFREDGATVIGADLNTPADGSNLAEHHFLDVTNQDSVDALVHSIDTNHGYLDAACLFSGVLVAGTVVNMSDDVWQRHLDVNLTGTFRMIRALVPQLGAADRASVTVAASTASFLAEPNDVGYLSSKGGLVMLMRSAAVDLAPMGIRVNAVCPGWIDTPFNDPLIEDPARHMVAAANAIPLQRQGTPEEVAGVVAFLASEDAAYVTGHALVVDGGFSVV